MRDYAKAAHWLRYAAQRDMAEAHFFLGIMLRDGLGVDRNKVVARTWFEKATAQGYGRAYFPCGKLYFEADPDPQLGKLAEYDLAKAYLWLSAAVKGSDDPAEVEQANEMLGQVLQVMPATWLPDLDAKVATHFTTYPPTKQ